jgi:hypothetical protein
MSFGMPGYRIPSRVRQRSSCSKGRRISRLC